MISNLKQLKSIPPIEEIRQLKYDTEIRKKLEKVLSPKKLLEAEGNSKDIFVYSFLYKSSGRKVRGYLIEPRKGKNLPCVVWNRGGSGEFGRIKLGQFFTLPQIVALVKSGYIVIASQYSGNAGSDGRDEIGGMDIHDVHNLYPILKKYTRADHTRIGMWGASRGGMMTYTMLTQASWIKAAVSAAGFSNMKRNFKERPGLKKKYSQMFNATPENIKKRSALFWPEKFPKNKPLLLMHGTADWRVNPLDSLELSQKLYEHRVPHRLVMYEGADHGLTEVRDESVQETIQWFDRFVKNREKLPNLKPHGK